MALLVNQLSESSGDGVMTETLPTGWYVGEVSYYERPRLSVIDGALSDNGGRRISSKRLFRLVRSVLILLIFVAGGSLLYSKVTAGTPSASTSVTYTVRAGDTLWSIVQRYNPNSDPRPLVQQLQGELGTTVITPGEKIVVPFDR